MIGPLLVQEVEIHGFDYGIKAAYEVNSLTLDGIRLAGQRVCGIYNGGQVMTLSDLVSINRVPALIGAGGMTTLVGAQLLGQGPAGVAIHQQKEAALFLRDIRSPGYDTLLSWEVNDGGQLLGPFLGEWTSHGVDHQAVNAAAYSLGLPIRRAPEVPWETTLDRWVNVQDYLDDDPETDDSEGIQRAIDEGGGTTLYFPAPYYYRIDDTVYLRGDIARVIGTHAKVQGKGALVLVEGSAPTVVVERFFHPHNRGSLALIQRSARTLVANDLVLHALLGQGPGDIFVNDGVIRALRFTYPGAKVWARQLNTERTDSVNILNAGADLWILGLKTEHNRIKLLSAAGRTELLGFLCYSLKREKNTPLLKITGGEASFAGVLERNFSQAPYPILVEENRHGKTLQWLRTQSDPPGGLLLYVSRPDRP
jgi:hypothetical protein